MKKLLSSIALIAILALSVFAVAQEAPPAPAASVTTTTTTDPNGVTTTTLPNGAVTTTYPSKIFNPPQRNCWENFLPIFFPFLIILPILFLSWKRTKKHYLLVDKQLEAIDTQKEHNLRMEKLLERLVETMDKNGKKD